MKQATFRIIHVSPWLTDERKPYVLNKSLIIFRNGQWHLSCFHFITVQRTLIISLLTIYLFGNTEMGQLVSIPRIFEHYQYHQLRPGSDNLNFIGFVCMHYIGNDGDIADDSQDSQLPFLHYIQPSSLFAVAPPAPYAGIPAIPILNTITAGIHSNGKIMKDFSLGLLRPPRLSCWFKGSSFECFWQKTGCTLSRQYILLFPARYFNPCSLS